MKHFSMILLMAAILLSSCGEHSIDEPSPLTKENPLEQLTSTTEVGLVEIGNIIKAFNQENNRPATRGNDFYASAICDTDGNPQIYVINFTDNRGFILISATKDYNPILAYNTEGNFDISGEFPGGLKLWQSETAEAMAYVKTLPEDSLIKFHHLWSKYEDHNPTSYSSRGLPENELGQILLAKKAELQSQGYIIHDINGSITGVNNIDRQFREEAEGGIHPEYDWRMYSFVASKDISIVQTCNNLISTTWGQEGQYNCTFPTKNGKRYVAGCGPVAAGQIMKYYKHPSKYSWTSMTNNIGNEAISNLLYDIGKSAKANFGTDNTSTTIGNMNKTFKSFGYTTSYILNNSLTL